AADFRQPAATRRDHVRDDHSAAGRDAGDRLSDLGAAGTTMKRRDRTGRRTLIVLAAVFAILLVINVIQSAESAKPQRLPFERVYPTMDDDDIQAVRLRAPSTDTTFTISRA